MDWETAQNHAPRMHMRNPAYYETTEKIAGLCLWKFCKSENKPYYILTDRHAAVVCAYCALEVPAAADMRVCFRCGAYVCATHFKRLQAPRICVDCEDPG